MGFYQLNGRWINISVFVGSGKGHNLAFRAGKGKRLAAAVTGGTDSLNHGINMIAVLFGVSQALYDNRADCLAQHNAVGFFIKRDTSAGTGQRSYL
ncbi:MAG: hypothetical protein SWC96_08205 [Thermodesulfobacteriota bacterium]|nr:hypothetical protein [Thermodesulfobacteriota bacterium]